MKVSYSLLFDPAEEEAGFLRFLVGICDDGRGHFASSRNIARLEFRDEIKTHRFPIEGDEMIELGASFRLSIEHDGEETVRAFEGKEQRGELPGATRASGFVFPGRIPITACRSAT